MAEPYRSDGARRMVVTAGAKISARRIAVETASPSRLIDESELGSCVRSISKRRLDAAVAFWGVGASKELQLIRCDRVRIILNLTSGACNPKEVRTLLGLPNVQVRNHAELHAKVWLGEDTAIVGSSNASTNGLAVEGGASAWREMNLLLSASSHQEALRRWFAARWRESRLISDADLALAEAAFERRRRTSGLVESAQLGLLHAFASHPEAFRKARIYLTLAEEYASAVELSAMRIAQREARAATRAGRWTVEDLPPNREWATFWEWHVPASAWLLSFTKVGRRQPCFDWIARTPAQHFLVQSAEGTRGRAAVMESAVQIDGQSFRLTAEEKTHIIRSFPTLLALSKATRPAFTLPLSRVVREIGLPKVRGRR